MVLCRGESQICTATSLWCYPMLLAPCSWCTAIQLPTEHFKISLDHFWYLCQFIILLHTFILYILVQGLNQFSKISCPGEPAPKLAGSVQRFEVWTLVLDWTSATLKWADEQLENWDVLQSIDNSPPLCIAQTISEKPSLLQPTHSTHAFHSGLHEPGWNRACVARFFNLTG